MNLLLLTCWGGLVLALPDKTCAQEAEVAGTPLRELQATVEQLFNEPTPEQLQIAAAQGGVVTVLVEDTGVKVQAASPESFPHAESAVEPAPVPDEWGVCQQSVRRSLEPRSFAITTYFGKVTTALATRISTAPARLTTNPYSLFGDLIMVFVSPRIKHKVRNSWLASGGRFGVSTVFTRWPHRSVANLSVATLDSILAYSTARLDNPNISGRAAGFHALNRFQSNFLSYVVIDSYTSGWDDHLVLEHLTPALIRHLCTLVPSGRWAARTARGAVVATYGGLSAGWEWVHYNLIRKRLFGSQDPKGQRP